MEYKKIWQTKVELSANDGNENNYKQMYVYSTYSNCM